MRKPMGISVLRIQEVPKKLWPLDIREMQGIGKKTAPLLIENGIHTIGDFADPANERKIMQLLGKNAYTKILNARGQDSNKLCFDTSYQSISQSTTLDKDINDYDEVKNVFRRLAASLSQRARHENIKGKHLSVSIRYNDFSTIVRSCSLNNYTNDADVILENAYLLFDKNNESSLPIRHLGIALGSLYSSTSSVEQIDLFAQPETLSQQDVLNELNKNLKSGSLVYASTLLQKK